VRLRLKLHSENGPSTIATAPRAPQPAAQVNVKDWGLVDERDEPGN
jgi:twitching motility protein PilU